MEMNVPPADAALGIGRMKLRQSHLHAQSPQSQTYLVSQSASLNSGKSNKSVEHANNSARFERTWLKSCGRWLSVRRAVLLIDGLACAFLATFLALLLIVRYKFHWVTPHLDEDTRAVAHSEIHDDPVADQVVVDAFVSFVMALAGVFGALRYNVYLLILATLLPCWTLLQVLRQVILPKYEIVILTFLSLFLHVKLIAEARVRPKSKRCGALGTAERRGMDLLEGSTEAFRDVEPGKGKRQDLAGSEALAATHAAFQEKRARSSCCGCCSVRHALLFMYFATISLNAAGLLTFVALKSTPGLLTDEQTKSQFAIVLAAGWTGAVEAGVAIVLGTVGVVGARSYDARFVAVAALWPCWQIIGYLCKCSGTSTSIDCFIHGLELCLVALFIREIRAAEAKASKIS